MKKQLIVMAITLIMTTSINAMQGQKSIAYNDQYKFDVYKYLTAKDLNDLKPGKTFTLTNVDKFAKPGSPQELRDANGNVWAKKTGAFFTGTSNRGSETWNIISTPAITAGRTPAVAPRETEAAVVKTAVQPPSESLGKAKTKEEIVLAYKAAIDAFKNNDVKALIRNFDRLPENMPQGGEEYLAKSGITDDTIMNAIKAAHPETQVAFFKYVTKKENPKAYDEEIARLTLKRAMYGKDKEMLLPAIKWLLEKEKVKDINGEALGEAIDSGFYEAAKLLKENGSPVTAYAKSSAERMFRNKKDDRFLKLLGINLPAAQTQAAPASAPVTAAATPAVAAGIPTDKEIIAILQDVAKAIENNNPQEIVANFNKLPTGKMPDKLEKLIDATGTNARIDNAFLKANKETKYTFAKAYIRQEDPLLQGPRFAAKLLVNAVVAKDLPYLQYLLDEKKIRDNLGFALEQAIKDNFYAGAELLIKNGSPKTQGAINAANSIALKDDRYQKLLGIAPSQPLVGKMADAQKDEEFKKAIESGNLEQVKKLIAEGASAEKFSATSATTPIAILIEANIKPETKVQIADYLLLKGADKDKRARNLALAEATEDLDIKWVNWLLAHGANDQNGNARTVAKSIADDFMQKDENRTKAQTIIDMINQALKK